MLKLSWNSLLRKPDNRIGQRPIFFLHVPKTAGTAVRLFLEAPLRRDEIYRVASSPAEIPRRRDEPFAPSIKFVSGHVPYWFKEAIPGAQTLLFLRDPVERVLSTYYYWKSLPKPAADDHSQEAELMREVEGVSLEDFVTNENAYWRHSISNYACLLVGHTSPWALDTPFDASTAARAHERLDSIEMVGVVERLSDSLSLIANRLGIPFEGALPSQNVTQKRREAAAIAPSIVAAIRVANESDAALLEHANTLIDKRRRPSPTFSFGARSAFDERFAPIEAKGGLTLRPGEQPILSVGWLGPETENDDSWRFASAKGPATLYVALPAKQNLSMIIDSPFASKGFDYGQLSIAVDGEQLAHEAVHAKHRTLIITSPIPPTPQPCLRKIVFHYERSQSVSDTHDYDSRVAFAVSQITLTASPANAPHMTWASVRVITAALTAEAETARAKRKTSVEYAAGLARAARAKEQYIKSLLAAIEEKDRNANSLAAAVADKDRDAAAFPNVLREKDRHIASLTQALAEKDRNAAKLSNALRDKDLNAAKLTRALEEKEQSAAALAAALKNLERNVASLTTALQEKELYAESLRRTLETKEVYAAELAATISDKDRYAASLAGAIEEKDRYAAALQEALDAAAAQTIPPVERRASHG